MIKIKDIIWKKDSDGYFTALVRDHQFLMLVPKIEEPYSTFDEFKDVLSRTKYYIHTTFQHLKFMVMRELINGDILI